MSVVINGQPPIRLVLSQTPGVGAPGVGVPAGGTTGQVLAKNSGTDYDTEWIAASGVGDLLAANNLSELTATAATARTNIGAETAGAAAAAQSAAIAAAATDATTKANAAQAAAIAASQPVDADLTTIAAANNGAVLAATTASFLTADESKLDGIEAGADVTDAANVAAAGAVMTSRTISTTAPLTGGGDLSANRTLAVSAATDTAAGVVELATDAETVTGTDTTRATTPAGVAAAIAAGGGGGGGWSGHPFVSPTISGSRRAIWPLGFNSHTTSGYGWQNTRAYAFWLPVERTLTALEFEVTSPSGTGGAVATVGVSPLDENMLGAAAIGWGQGSITSTGYKSVAIGVTMPSGWYAVWFRAGQGGCTVRGVNANGPVPAFAGDATTMNGVGGFNQQNWADDSLPVPANWFNGIGQAWVLTAAPTVQNVALVLDEP